MLLVIAAVIKPLIFASLLFAQMPLVPATVDESKVMHPYKALNCKITTVHWYFDGNSTVMSSVVLAESQKACREQEKILSKNNPDPKKIKSVVVHAEWIAKTKKK
jgi:hypothetical protein